MNEDKKLAGQFLPKIERLLRHSVPGGGLEPAASIEHCERTIAAAPESSRELLRKLARFATCGAVSEVAKRTWEKV